MKASIRAALGGLAIAAALAEAAGPAVRVDGAWSRRAPKLDGSGNGAVYGTLVNPGASPDALIAAKSDVAGIVEVHETYAESGMSMMRAIERIPVPAGGQVGLAPGGYHVMLLNLKRDLRPGEAFAVTFVFERAGPVAVSAQVR